LFNLGIDSKLREAPYVCRDRPLQSRHSRAASQRARHGGVLRRFISDRSMPHGNKNMRLPRRKQCRSNGSRTARLATASKKRSKRSAVDNTSR
jgi:hypothetical protein